MNTLEIAKNLKITHYSINKIITKYESYFIKLGDLEYIPKTANDKITMGRPMQLRELNNNHLNFLITLLKNTDENLKLKIELIKKNS